jgi:DNA polymerase III delta subunit
MKDVTLKELDKQILGLLHSDEGAGWVWLQCADEYLQRRILTRSQKNLFKDRVTYFSGSDLTVADLIDELSSLQLFMAKAKSSDGRLIVVRQADQLKDADELLAQWNGGKKQRPAANPWAPNVLLFLSTSIDGRRKLPQLLKQCGVVFSLDVVSAADRNLLINEMAKDLDLTLNAQAQALLAIMAEESLGRVQQELEKIALYLMPHSADDNGAASESASVAIPVTAEHIQALCATVARFDMAELVKAVFEGYRTRALLLSQHLIRGPDDALGLVGFMNWAVCHPDKFRWGRRPQPSRLMAMVPSLLDLDRRLKSSGQDPRLLVDNFIVESV